MAKLALRKIPRFPILQDRIPLGLHEVMGARLTGLIVSSLCLVCCKDERVYGAKYQTSVTRADKRWKKSNPDAKLS